MTDKILDKVRALLAKAESTDFPEEAETYTAKAQELMARYAIEEAMLADASGPRSFTVANKLIDIADPYARIKAALLGIVARRNDCQVIGAGGTSGFGRTRIYGTETDIGLIESVWTSLLMQQARAVVQAERETHFYGDVKSFRRSFMIGYANRIDSRLAEAKRTARKEYEQETGNSTALVLANKAELVRDTFNQENPNITQSSVRSSNRAAYGAGQSAANNANLGQRSVGQRKAVTS